MHITELMIYSYAKIGEWPKKFDERNIMAIFDHFLFYFEVFL